MSFTAAAVPPRPAKLPVGTFGDENLIPDVDNTTEPCDISSVPVIDEAVDMSGKDRNTKDTARTRRYFRYVMALSDGNELEGYRPSARIR
jgi:hypothetical protein